MGQQNYEVKESTFELLKSSISAKILMLEKIFKVISCVVVSIGLILSTLFVGGANAEALNEGFSSEEALTPGNNGDNPLGIVMERSDDKELMKELQEEMSMKDIFGDEQVFPFEPGLGNSAF